MNDEKLQGSIGVRRNEPSPNRVGGRLPDVRVYRPRSIAWHALAGFAFGYVLLHPVAMLIFRWFDPRLAHSLGATDQHMLWGPLGHAFRPEMLPMGLVFGLFTAAIAVVDGYYRANLEFERDRLARQLAINEEYRRALEDQAATLRLQNERLVALERSKRRTTQFMVHDFKNYLAGILGFAELLLDRPDLPQIDPMVPDALAIIRKQALRMRAAVLDLLDYARLGEAVHLRIETVTAGQLLQSAAGDVTLPSEETTVSVGAALDTALRVDRRLIERVLVNLAGNAIKHNGRGVEVVLGAEIAADGSEVLFVCRDNGAGIPPEAIATIFDEFISGENTGYRESTGLGLAFCKAAIEAHGGRIWCESTEGRGACFTFTIPLGMEKQR